LTFLLDTNAISEPGRPRPDPAFTAWFDAIPEADVFLSVVTVGELQRGVAMLQPGEKREKLEASQEAVLRIYGDRILKIDVPTALVWGELTAKHRRRGLNPSVSDELIAATALVHDLIVVTRNVSDFEGSGCKIVSPWSI
jgi:predicted nucleic acid-binding protein